MKKILIFLATLLVTTTTSAGLWPVITSIRPELIASSGSWVSYNYYITQQLLEIGPSVDVVMPNKYLILTHRHNPHTDNVIGYGTNTINTKTSSSQTISNTAVDFYNKTGSGVAYINHNGDQPTKDECVAYVIGPQSNSLSWSQVLVPGGCLSVPESPRV